MRILIVDDDPVFRSTVCQGLQDSGVQALPAADAEEALELLRGHGEGWFDVILLDVMLPAQTGWDVLSTLRGEHVNTPVIFVTARDSVDERVKGLRLGADDYIIKPFAFQELLARVEAVVRRRREVPTFQVDDVVIDLRGRRVERGGARIELTPREFDVLHALVEAGGRTVSRAELLQRVWNIEFDPETNLVDVHVARLRRKLGRGGRPLIETVIGQGYRLCPAEAAPSSETP